MVDLRQFRAELEYALREAPSKFIRLAQALDAIESGLAVLSSAGYHFQLAEGPQERSEWKWPRIYYHHSEDFREVLSEAHLKELGEGWYPSLGEAIQARGEAIQFAGRAGVRRWRGLVALADERSKDEVGKHDSTAADALRDSWRKSNGLG